MARNKKPRTNKPNPPAAEPEKNGAAEVSTAQSLRETVESIVIAFVLAFLFRTFEAEAFVIPTGSMAPTLMGRHKDVYCSECGQRFQITASDEASDEIKAQQAKLKYLERNGGSQREKIGTQSLIAGADCLAGVCANCRFTMPVDDQLPTDVPERRLGLPISEHRSFAGDRILVNKYIYSFTDPQRWDVVVFKFPGNAQQNYIKRLVGLPGETLRVYQGDLFTADGENPGDEIPGGGAFAIARKPPGKVHAMRQLVHDTDHDARALFEAGWPMSWNATSSGWEITRQAEDKTVKQQFVSNAESDGPAWIRYQNVVPDYDQWLAALAAAAGEGDEKPLAAVDAAPQLVTDFNAYNARVNRRHMYSDQFDRPTLRADPTKLGMHWVGDLTLEADVDVESAGGALLVDLVEGGVHFTCSVDLATGEATLAIDGQTEFAPTAATPLQGTGRHRVALANVDDQLLLWVDDKLMAFDGPTTYDADTVFGDRRQLRPQSTSSDPGDLSPAGIAASGAQVAIDRLRVYRDIYYIATDWQENQQEPAITDMPRIDLRNLDVFLSDPQYWDAYLERGQVEFPLTEDQFFVMGDNSPESLDARLWRGEKQQQHGGRPGGSYLERELLIGKALCVYWPHSWYHIPGTPIPVFPNFADMRLVR